MSELHQFIRRVNLPSEDVAGAKDSGYRLCVDGISIPLYTRTVAPELGFHVVVDRGSSPFFCIHPASKPYLVPILPLIKGQVRTCRDRLGHLGVSARAAMIRQSQEAYAEHAPKAHPFRLAPKAKSFLQRKISRLGVRILSSRVEAKDHGIRFTFGRLVGTPSLIQKLGVLVWVPVENGWAIVDHPCTRLLADSGAREAWGLLQHGVAMHQPESPSILTAKGYSDAWNRAALHLLVKKSG